MKYLKTHYFLFAFAFLIHCKTTYAQDSKLGNWLIYNGNQAINDKWNWHNEVQYRSYNIFGDLQQLLLRTGIGYNLTENNNNVLLGYAYVHSQNYLPNLDQKINTDENRIFQQFLTRQNFGRVYMQHRFRIEERFLPNNFKMRFRYSFAVNVPLNKPKMEEKAFYFSAYNEVFLNGDTPVFDRDRIYGGMGYIINKNIRVEAGFMRQMLEFTAQNQFQVIVHNSIPLYKKKN